MTAQERHRSPAEKAAGTVGDSNQEMAIGDRRSREYAMERSQLPAIAFATHALFRSEIGSRLTGMRLACILICMRTTLNIDDRAIKKASELTGIKAKTTLVRLGLEALIARESAKRLADLGGTETQLRPVPRRRPE
jgi:Arc/MetJ family transcription regulator